MSLTGNLNTISFPDLLQLLSQGKKTGTLTLSRHRMQKQIAFRNGNVIYACSVNDKEDLFGSMLLKRGRISKSDLKRALQVQKSSGKKLGTVLVELDLFSREEVIEALKLQIEEIVYTLFGWDEAQFGFDEGKLPPDDQIQTELNTVNIIMEGTRRIDEWVEVQKVLPGPDVPLKPVLVPQGIREEVRLTLDEFQMLVLVDGNRTVPDLLELSPVGEFVTSKALYKLVVAGLIEPGEAKPQSITPAEEEKLLYATTADLYRRCFRALWELWIRKVGEGNLPLWRAKGRPGRPEDDILDWILTSESIPAEKLLARLHTIPAHLRIHKFFEAANARLTEAVERIAAVAGAPASRKVTSNIRRELALPIAEQRALLQKYDVEEELFTALRAGT
jgi:hypothetical protein